MTCVKPQAVYEVKARRISGTRAEKLEQIDVAIQELLDIKTLECAGDNPNVRFLAVPRPRSFGFAMTLTILVLLAILVLLLGVRTSHAQDAAVPADPAPVKKADPFAFADFTWLSGNASGEFQVTQRGVGGDFHYDKVQGWLMTQFGMYAQTTPRNDASPARGQRQLDTAYAQMPDAPPSSPPQWEAGAFADLGYLNDPNDPANHLFRTRGTTPRVDELNLNMTAAWFRKTATASSRWGIEATVQTGEDAKAFGFSPTAPNVSGANWLRHLGPTDVSMIVPAGRGLTVQAGIFSSLIGYDSLYAKDNFTYTRPWCADFTPYLMLGANAAYPLTDKVTVTGFLVNSYFHLSHPNDVPNVGGQLAYAVSPRVSIKETVLTGSHQTDTSFGSWRVLSDTIVERKAGRLTAAGEVQLATETVTGTGERASWVALQFPVHLAVAGPWSVSLRPELARDPSGRYTSVRQTVWAITSSAEYRRTFSAAQAIVRVEYRYDRSTGTEGGFYSGSGNQLTAGQPLLIGSLILTYGYTHKATK